MKTKKLLKKAHYQVVKLTILSLLITPLSLSYGAFDLSGENTNMVMGLFDKTMGIYQQNKQQEQYAMASMQQNAMVNALRSKHNPRNIPARYFPLCPIPAKVDPPKGVCQPNPTREQVGTSQQMIYLAGDHMTHFDKMSNPQDSSTPGGLACITEQKNQVDKKIAAKIASLDTALTQLEQTNTLAKNNFNQALDEMDSLNQTLTGKDSGRLKDKVRTLSDLFEGTACVDVVGTSSIDASKGLLVMRGKLRNSGLIKQANDVISNESRIKKTIDKEIADTISHIKKYGVGSMYQGREIGNFKGLKKSINAAAKAEYTEVYKRYEVINKELQNDFPGWSLYGLNKNFQKNIKNFSSGASSYFKKRSINTCVTKSNKRGGIGFTLKRIAAEVYQPNAAGNSTTARNYRRALKAILDKDNFIEDKVRAIEALDASFSNSVRLKINFDFAGKQSITPSSYFNTVIKKCKQNYNASKVFSTGVNSDVRSEKEIVEQAERSINELKNLESKFASTVAKKIREEVENCEDEGYDPKQLDYKKADSFCLSSARKAATAVNSCHAKVKEKVNEYETKVVKLRDKFNAAVIASVTKQQQDLNKLKENVLSDLRVLDQNFPEVKLLAPKMLGIMMPKKEKDTYGVRLMGANLAFLDEFPRNIRELQKILKNTGKQVERNIEKYIAEQKRSMKKAAAAWASFAETCNQGVASFQRAEEQRMAEEQKQYDDMMENTDKARAYCSRFQNLGSSHPGPGCNGKVEGLSDDYGEVERYLNDGSRVSAILNEYEQFCHLTQAEQIDDEKQEKVSLYDLCADNNFSWKSVVADLETQVPEYAKNEIDKDKKEEDEGGATYKKYLKSKKKKKKEDDDDPKSVKGFALKELKRRANNTDPYEQETANDALDDMKNNKLKKAKDQLAKLKNLEDKRDEIDKQIKDLQNEPIQEPVKAVDNAKLKVEESTIAKLKKNEKYIAANKNIEIENKKLKKLKLDQKTYLDSLRPERKTPSALKRNKKYNRLEQNINNLSVKISELKSKKSEIEQKAQKAIAAKKQPTKAVVENKKLIKLKDKLDELNKKIKPLKKEEERLGDIVTDERIASEADDELEKMKTKSWNPEDNNICLDLRRSAMINMTRDCKKEDAIESCVNTKKNEKEFDMMEETNDVYRSIEIKLKKFYAAKDPENHSAVWQGLGQTAMGSCISNYDRERTGNLGQNLGGGNNQGANVFNGMRGIIK